MTNDDMISRQNVLRCLTDISYNHCKTQGEADVIDTAKTMVAVMSSAQPDLCNGCDRYGASCVGEGCGKLEMPEVAKDTNVPINGCISRQAAIDAVNQYNFDFPQYMERFVTELRDAMKADLKHDIEALPSAQPEPCEDVVSREYLTEHIEACWMNGRMMKPDLNEVLSWIDDIPSAQPEITPDGTLTVSIDADIASVGRILLSQTGTQRGCLYYKDVQQEETCDTCKYGYFGAGKCDNCRVGYPSHYERRTDE